MAGFAIVVCTSSLVQFASIKLGSARSSVLLLPQVSFIPPALPWGSRFSADTVVCQQRSRFLS